MFRRSLPALLLIASVALAQTPGDRLFDRYLARVTSEVSERFLDGARTLEEWQARRPRLHQEFLDMLGLWPLPEKTPLYATVTGTLDHDDVMIDKLHYQSRPDLYVTANLYRPKANGDPASPKKKLPGVLYVCGHSGRGRDGNKTAFQDHGLWFARNGYVCLVVDTLQLGELAGIHHGTYREGRWWWQALGYTPAGVECWNGIRGLDYLASRRDVDPERLGVTGISGGGATTMWVAAADERVKCAVPVSGMSDLESYVTNKVINGHCDCMFVVNGYGWEWTTIAALIAPRPLLFANSDNDTIFPMDGNRRIIERLRRAYKLFGKEDLVAEHVSKGGHDYRPDLRIAIFRWMNRHLGTDATKVEDVRSEPLLKKELRVFSEDSDFPRGALNSRIDETFVSRAVVKLPEPAAFAEWQKELHEKLRQRSFRAFPERIPAATLESKGNGRFDAMTEPGITVPVWNVEPGGKKAGALLVVLNPGEEAKTTPEWAKPHVAERSVHVLAPRGVGETAYTPKSPPNYVARAHALLGRTIDQGRVWDVAGVARALAKEHGSAVLGRGQAGVIAAYAALFEPDITGVVALEPPATHRDGPIFLGVLRVLDVPEALGLLAPRPLTLATKEEKDFARVAELYRRAGAEGKVKVVRE
jgi:dienelactone hydrolase